MKRQTVKKLIQCVAIIAAGVLAIILFMLAIWCRGKNSEPVTDEQVAAQMQQAEPLVIETPEAAAEGSIQSEETITLLAIENSKPHKDGLLFRICQYVEFKQRARRENEKL